MKIDKKLNLVSNITRSDGSIVYLHVTPFPYEVVEEYCVLLGNLFTNFIAQVGPLGSARVAAMMLRKRLRQDMEARKQENQSLAEPPQTLTIVDEIQRLTVVVYSDDGQWKTAPLEVAFKQGIIDPDEYREVEGEVGNLPHRALRRFAIRCRRRSRISIPRPRMPSRKRHIYPLRLGVE